MKKILFVAGVALLPLTANASVLLTNAQMDKVVAGDFSAQALAFGDIISTFTMVMPLSDGNVLSSSSSSSSSSSQ